MRTERQTVSKYIYMYIVTCISLRTAGVGGPGRCLVGFDILYVLGARRYPSSVCVCARALNGIFAVFVCVL